MITFPACRRLSFKLIILVLISLIVRIFFFLRPQIITNDGVLYIEMARAFSEGTYAGAQGNYFTLYPIIIYFVQKIVGNWELSGQLVSVTLGALTVIPVFLLGRSLYHEKIGWLSAIFYITLPNFVRFDSQVLRDPTYWFFMAFTLWLVWEGLRKYRLLVFSLASISVGLAAITRLEGFVVWGALVLLTALWGRRLISFRRRCLALMVFVFAFPLILSPFLLFTKRQSTEIAFRELISFSVTVINGSRLGIQDPMEAISEKTYDSLPGVSKNALELASRHRMWVGITEVIYKFVKSANFLIVFILLGIWRRRKEGFSVSDGYLFFVFGALFLVDILYAQQIYYFSTRHGLTLVLLMLHFGGPGLIFAAAALSRIDNRILRRWDFIKRYPLHLLAVLLVIIFIIQGISLGTNKLELKEVGVWLKEEGYEGSVIMAPEEFVRLVFYADGQFVKMPGSWEEAIRHIHQAKVQIVVVNTRTVKDDCPGFSENWQRGGLFRFQGPLVKKGQYSIEIYGLRENRTPG